ncbi:MAG: patatin-like phospholipase family protein [Cyanobacteria bacterium]|nr:patatin-like phospholipase family protein [Cyanobacteriota bacterium]
MPSRYRKLSKELHLSGPGPKRILALDGGGLKGILTLGYLETLEQLLRQRHGNDPDFRLSDYFDLIAGTSTGAIIAACLALGMSVVEVLEKYQKLGRNVFSRDWLRQGVIRARYDKGRLESELKSVFGSDTTLESDQLRTGLLVMSKRLDTGSPWPMSNNPKGKYFRNTDSTSHWISNADYPLWKVVRASTAAPTFFDPEEITIIERPGMKPEKGQFVDGGVSPFNNPALQAFLFATLKGYNLSWSSGADNLLLVSVGTGRSDPSNDTTSLAATGAITALMSLMNDCGNLVETMMQWLSASETSRVIDSECGDLRGDILGGKPMLTYLRYDMALTKENAVSLCPDLALQLGEQLNNINAMDNPLTMDLMLAMARKLAQDSIHDSQFEPRFDLPQT